MATNSPGTSNTIQNQFFNNLDVCSLTIYAPYLESVYCPKGCTLGIFRGGQGQGHTRNEQTQSVDDII